MQACSDAIVFTVVMLASNRRTHQYTSVQTVCAAPLTIEAAVVPLQSQLKTMEISHWAQ